jgi:hypothetical protein
MSADCDEDYADETFEPDHAAEKLILQGQLDAAKQQIASLEASLRTARVAGRRQKASGDEPSHRAQSEVLHWLPSPCPITSRVQDP